LSTRTATRNRDNLAARINRVRDFDLIDPLPARERATTWPSMSEPKPEAVALKAAHALSVRNPPHRDWCGFAHDVGAELFKISNARDGVPGVEAVHLALGILDAQAQHGAELDEKLAAEDDAERQQARERRDRLRELIRLVTIDGKPVEGQSHAT
jgi:hypothetical protein